MISWYTVYMTIDSGVLLSVGSDGFSVVSDSISEKLAKKSLSPSLISSLNDCPARWLGDNFVVRDLIETPADTPGRRGNLFHSVMEFLFALPAEERTQSATRSIVAQVLASEEYADIAAVPEAVEWLKEAVRGYYRMGAKPRDIEVAKVPEHKTGELVDGLEVFVKGKIGDTSRDILGYIDRVSVNTVKNDGSVIVEDFKSGKVKEWNPRVNSKDGYAEVRQQVIYTQLLEARGMKVSGARLIYPMAQKVVSAPVLNEKVREMVRADVEEADDKLSLMIEENLFPTNPTYLCSWCPLAKICPSADIKPYNTMQKAYAEQPDAALFHDVVERRKRS